MTVLRLPLVAAAISALAIGAVQNGEASDVKRFELTAQSSTIPISEGVNMKAFTFNHTSPGKQMIVQQGDIVEITVHNEDTIAHGLSIHAADAQTSKYVGNIGPGESKTVTFEAKYPGVFMYHCAPGGHGIMAHTMGGQHGMIVVEPNDTFKLEEKLGREPELKVYLLQHEVYANGRDFFDGNAQYVMFNGESFRYVREPIKAQPGDYVRFYYLNVGPNLTSTFHAVGGVWDYMYYQGNPANVMVGGQSVISGPTDSWVVEWEIPEGEGPYTFVSHAFGTQAIKGAVGIIDAAHDNERDAIVRSEGPTRPPYDDPKRLVDPFGLGSEELDRQKTAHMHENRVFIEMVGNSFHPKRKRVPIGTEVVFVNEDVFDLLDGELTGRHNAITIEAEGDEPFYSDELMHGETWSVTFTEKGHYRYFCSLHPYMIGEIEIYDPHEEEARRAEGLAPTWQPN
jgi:nitrite reductase (NO-forming)